MKHLFDFKSVATSEKAETLLLEISVIFYGLSVLTAIFVLRRYLQHVTISPAHVAYPVDFLILGYCIGRHQSRMTALIAVVLAAWHILVTGSHLTDPSGGRHVFLAVVFLIVALRATQVSFAYHTLIASRISIKNVIIKNLLAMVYIVAVTVLLLIVYYVVEGNIAHHGGTFWDSAYILCLILTIGLTYGGRLPFTHNKPFVVRS